MQLLALGSSPDSKSRATAKDGKRLPSLRPLYVVLLPERCVHGKIDCDLDLHVHFWTTTSVSCQAMSFQICKTGHDGIESHKLSQMFCAAY